MAVISTAPFVLKDCIIQIGTDSYETAISTARFVPSLNIVKAKGLTPASVYADTDNPEWEVTISFLQDWSTTNSLSQFLLANAGTSKVVVFKPQGITTGKPIITATVTIVPGDIGGDQGAFADATVTLPVTGQPVKTAAP